MQSFRVTGSWFSYVMGALFFLLIFSAILSIFGIGDPILAAAHRSLGIAFSALFSLHLISTVCYHLVHAKRQYKTTGSTTYHILHRQQRILLNPAARSACNQERKYEGRVVGPVIQVIKTVE